MGRGKVSLSKKVKNSVKQAVKFIDDFEQTAIDIAIENNYDFVACGHIHQPALKQVTTEKGSTTYMNSGDWIENLTSLEYSNGAWTMYQYEEAAEEVADEEEFKVKLPAIELLYHSIVQVDRVGISGI